MAHSQQKFRELVLQLLFSQDFSQPCERETLEMLMKKLEMAKSSLRLASARVEKISEKFPEIDKKIAAHSREYDFSRIPRLERSLLRLGVFELLYDDKIPAKVTISEAVRLARKFATPEASAFINAVLDATLRDKEASAIV